MNNDLKKLYRDFTLLYARYKDWKYYSVSLYLFIIFISVLILLYAVIPQVKSWLSIQEEITATEERISIMRQNVIFLNSLNESQLESDFSVASAALPPERDVSLLIGAINYAAANAGVGLEDFSFQGGKISSRSPADTTKPGTTDTSIQFNAKGSLSQVQLFLSELQKKMPILSVTSIHAQFTDANAAEIRISYYYKAFPLLNDEVSSPLKNISSENRLLLEKLRSWKLPEDTSYVPIGSEAASPL